MNKKAQSGIEYGAFFAFSLMLGLIIITLIGKFPGFGVEGKIEESRSYWYQKKPVSIEDMVYYSNGKVVVLLRNKHIKTLEIINISTNEGTIEINENVSSDETLIVNQTGFPECNASNTEEVVLKNVVISYKFPESDTFEDVFKVSGTVPLRSYCIQAPEESSSGGGGGGGCVSSILFALIFFYEFLFPKLQAF